MRADPEPDDVVAFAHAESAIVKAYANRVDGARRVDRLEAKARVTRVGSKESVGALGL